MQGVRRLPLPYGLTYLLLFLLNVVINYLVDWMGGSMPAFHFPLIVCFYPLMIWGTLAIMTWLDDTARKALHRFGPLLDVHAETMQRLEYEFTTMPPRGLVVRTVFWTFLYVIFLGAVYFPWSFHASTAPLRPWCTHWWKDSSRSTAGCSIIRSGSCRS